MNKLNNLISIVVVSLFLNSCASAPPKPLNGESSVIAIKIGSTVHTGMLTWEPIRPVKVFFIKLNDDNSIKSGKIIESSLNIEAWWGDNVIGRNTTYLFNVEPGKYAAVATYGVGYIKSTDVLILFSEALIESTVIEVKAGSFVYMGAFLSESRPFTDVQKEGDDMQKYYFNYFIAIDKKFDGILFDNLVNKKILYFTASLKEEIFNKNSKEIFLKSQLEEFKGTEWEIPIKKELLLVR